MNEEITREKLTKLAGQKVRIAGQDASVQFEMEGYLSYSGENYWKVEYALYSASVSFHLNDVQSIGKQLDRSYDDKFIQL